MKLEEMKTAVEVDDTHILLGEPIKLIKFGRNKNGTENKKDMKEFVIRQLNWFYEWDKFTYNLAIFLMFYEQVIEHSTLPDSLDDLNTFRDNLRTAMTAGNMVSNKHKNQSFNALCEICALSGVRIKWMKKNFGIDDWIEIFMYFYLYNVLGKKKGLRDVQKLLGVAQLSYSKQKAKFSSGLKKSLASKN